MNSVSVENYHFNYITGPRLGSPYKEVPFTVYLRNLFKYRAIPVKSVENTFNMNYQPRRPSRHGGSFVCIEDNEGTVSKYINYPS